MAKHYTHYHELGAKREFEARISLYMLRREIPFQS